MEQLIFSLPTYQGQSHKCYRMLQQKVNIYLYCKLYFLDQDLSDIRLKKAKQDVSARALMECSWHPAKEASRYNASQSFFLPGHFLDLLFKGTYFMKSLYNTIMNKVHWDCRGFLKIMEETLRQMNFWKKRLMINSVMTSFIIRNWALWITNQNILVF